jgi:hypothetical protein
VAPKGAPPGLATAVPGNVRMPQLSSSHNQNNLEKVANDKHPSLFYLSVREEVKVLKTLKPGFNVKKLFLSISNG